MPQSPSGVKSKNLRLGFAPAGDERRKGFHHVLVQTDAPIHPLGAHRAEQRSPQRSLRWLWFEGVLICCGPDDDIHIVQLRLFGLIVSTFLLRWNARMRSLPVNLSMNPAPHPSKERWICSR